MRFDLLTIFPDFFTSPLEYGVLKKALEKGVIEIAAHDIRVHTSDKHRSVDDKPYGGGGGMVLKPEPLGRAVESVRAQGAGSTVVLASPQGERLTDGIAKELAGFEQVVIICGRYEGVDERVRELFVDREISIGDFVLSGGEYAALVIVDAVARYVPGVLGNEASPFDDSFSAGLLEHPQYTRPEEYMGLRVPEVLLSGNHAAVERWRRRGSLKRTFLRRPDLLDRTPLGLVDSSYLRELKMAEGKKTAVYVALVHYPVYNTKFDVITTAFTNLDVHDIARAAKTYGVRRFFLVHPLEEQRALVRRVLDFWGSDKGAQSNSSKSEALDLAELKYSVKEAVEEVHKLEGKKPKVVVTDARARENMTGYGELRERIFEGRDPYLILFGTGSGIAEELINSADYVLKPLSGGGDFNHLSVRSAASIVLDRLLSA